jgi:hypothetical protein
VPPAQFVDFEKQYLAFLAGGEYKRLRWCGDKGVRDTGPFIQRVYYGSHPAVKVYYSPKVMAWLIGGREGPIPDGAMIVKEQFRPPAGRYEGVADNQLPPPIEWTVMIKDSQGAKDGWFWGDFYPGMAFDDDQFPFQYPAAGFGLTCVRCHATAEKELTFSALNNIEGFAGEPLRYEDDGSWRSQQSDETVPAHGRRIAPAAQQDAVAIDTVQKLLSERTTTSCRRPASRGSSSARPSACRATPRSRRRSARSCS